MFQAAVVRPILFRPSFSPDPYLTQRLTSDPCVVEPNNDRSATRNPYAGPSTSVASLAVHTDASSSQADSRGTSKKSKPKSFHGILSRSRSTRDERSPDVDKFNQKQEPDRHLGQREPARPAPNQGDPRDTMGSNQRQHSEDRHLTSRDLTKENGKAAPSFSSSLRDGGSGGHSFLSNLKSSATKGAGAIQKGLFGKGGRSATPEKDGPLGDEHYVLKTLNLPLVEQTRLTRISKKLEDSRDKTEFWMPAFPWRAIDYLNYKGSDVEGLYRVPGSSVEIKKWQRKFDERRFQFFDHHTDHWLICRQCWTLIFSNNLTCMISTSSAPC